MRNPIIRFYENFGDRLNRRDPLAWSFTLGVTALAYYLNNKWVNLALVVFSIPTWALVFVWMFTDHRKGSGNA